MHESLLEEGSGPPLVILPHTAGVSKDIRWVCRKYEMKVVFRKVQSLHLICCDQGEGRIAIGEAVLGCVPIPCSCGKMYIGKTKRRLKARL